MRVQSRRTDAFPMTWEIPVGIGLVWLLGTVLALPTGQGIVFVICGHGFVWPGPQVGPSLIGLFAGTPGRGLSVGLVAALPSVLLIYAAALMVEAALTVATVLGLAWWWRTVGPSAQFGMAARHEVAAVLGRQALMRRRKTIRPDLADRRSRR